ncbi:thioredoxin fold domain-containing protein [Campylobacter upsaliensis]|nr:thioredoxin fold domain-containing protein [Campylobacter upsaliensis]
MKKIILLASACLSLFAASDKEILDFYSSSVKAQFPDAKLSIVKREKVADTGFESVVLSIEVQGAKQEEVLFTKDNLIVPDIIDLKAKTSYRQEFEIKKFEEARENFSKNAKKEAQKEKMIISLGDKNKQPSIYVFSDPECPYCIEQLKNIEEELKTKQINLILTPVAHGKSAFEKSALIYKESKNAKTDAEKLAILRKYFDPTLKDYPKISEAETKAVFELYRKYRSLGLVATPTIIQ